MAIVYKELGQPCNIKHSIELGWGVNEDASMPPLHDIGPPLLASPAHRQNFLCQTHGRGCSGLHVFAYISWLHLDLYMNKSI